MENLGIGLSKQGKKVLLIDADPQASLTISLGYPQPDDLEPTLSDLLNGTISENPVALDEVLIHQQEGIDLIPSNISLVGLEVSLVNTMNRERILKQFLETLREDYDYILLDCVPSLGMLTVNALAASDATLVPVQANYLSAKGLEQLLATINQVKRQINPKLCNPFLSEDGKGTDTRAEYRDYFIRTLNLDILKERNPYDDGQIDEILEILLDVVCSNRKQIRIAGDDKPAQVVKSQLMKLDSSHIEFVLDCMKQNTTQIRNVKQYILAALYNAPLTINNYYQSLVQHDMATGKI